MYPIVAREELAPNIFLFRVEAPQVARKAQPGQFIMLRVDETGERIPLTIADFDRERGTVDIVFAAVGRTTRKLAHLQKGDSIANFVGPLGLPAEIGRFGTVVCVAVGYGMATMVPIARALKEVGNRVIGIAWARQGEYLFGLDRLRAACSELIVSAGNGADHSSFVIQPLRHVLQGGQPIHRVVVIGPACVMRYVSLTTKPYGIKTVVSLNPIMVDGTGMCGACRVAVGGVTKFACVDGPAFDGHLVEWDLLLARRCTYTGNEDQLSTFWQCEHCAQW